MELHDWLLDQSLATKKQYAEIIKHQFEGTVHDCEFDLHGYLVPHAMRPELHQSVRRHPVGDVLSHLAFKDEIFARAKVRDLPELVHQWQQWHVDHAEPLGHYSTVSRCGKNLFTQRVEKKIASLFATTNGRGDAPAIRNGDTVVIPEGSSAFYLAMMIAARRKKITIITSNAMLIGEYYNNPCLANAFHAFHVIGGQAYFDSESKLPEHAGFFGMETEAAYEKAITENPRATVVVIPTSGFLPKEGPFATDGAVQGLKLSLLKASLDANVREILFLADYTKHLQRNRDSFGTPILPAKEWKQRVTTHHDKICLVTVPSPKLRSALEANGAGNYHPARRFPLSEMYPGVEFGSDDHEYAQAAREFCDYLRNSESFYEALAVTTPQPAAV